MTSRIVFHLPLPAIVAAALAIVCVWGVPAAVVHASGPEGAAFGESRSLTFACQEPKQLQLTWTGEVNLAKTQSKSRLLPQIGFADAKFGGPDPGDCVLITAKKVYVNEHEVWGSFGQDFIDPQAVDLIGRSSGPPEPQEISDLRGSFEHVGPNSVRIEIQFRVEVRTPGTAHFEWTGGPMAVQTIDADGDGDGIPDNKQPVPGVHTGLIAISAAVLAGGACWIVVGMRRRRRRGKT